MKLAALAIVAAALPLFASDSLVDTLSKHLKTSKEYTLAIAAQMPAADYSFKPNPAEMSFGEQMNHIANANAMFGGMLDNTKGKDYKGGDKDAVIANLTASFDNAIGAVGKLSDDDLHRMVKSDEGEMSLLNGILLMLDHTTHHRAQCVVYLRVKGVKPAEYRF